MNYKIALIKGDGIGPEVVGEAVKVMDAIGEKFGHTFEYTDILMGGCAIDEVGRSYPEGTAEKCRACDAVLLGAVGGPRWGHSTDPDILGKPSGLKPPTDNDRRVPIEECFGSSPLQSYRQDLRLLTH